MPKISGLPQITNIAPDDELAIRDVSAETTKGISIEQLLGVMYPVGSIYTNASVNTNPATLLGFGTWEAFASGRVLVGVDSGQTEFDTLGETGGAKTHAHGLTPGTAYAQIAPVGINQDVNRVSTPSWSSNHRQSVSGAANTSQGNTYGLGVDGDTDSGSTLQPYITVYMWKRTA